MSQAHPTELDTWIHGDRWEPRPTPLTVSDIYEADPPRRGESYRDWLVRKGLAPAPGRAREGADS